MFEQLADVTYLVMRNFEGLPDEVLRPGHGDVDFLVTDQALAADRLHATRVDHRPSHYRTATGILVDLRYVGDDYYDRTWQEDMLATKVTHNGVWVPNEEHHFYSLLYHALVHKGKLRKDYASTLKALKPDVAPTLKVLTNWMDDKGYQFVRCTDPSVGWKHLDL